MSSLEEQSCPLCQSEAEFIYQDYRQQKQFTCPKCTWFTITRQAETQLTTSTQSWKDQVSEAARETPGHEILEIRTEPVPDQRSELCAVRVLRNG